MCASTSLFIKQNERTGRDNVIARSRRLNLGLEQGGEHKMIWKRGKIGIVSFSGLATRQAHLRESSAACYLLAYRHGRIATTTMTAMMMSRMTRPQHIHLRVDF